MSDEKPTVEGEKPKKRRGRPPKSELTSKSFGNRGAVGRPKGDASIINEYKARMLASPKSTKVLEKIFEAALEDDHKHQAAAWKIITDRILPVGAFEQDVVKGAGKNSIQINISGINGVSVNGEQQNDDPIDGEYEVND